jgi:hypothetical protein
MIVDRLAFGTVLLAAAYLIALGAGALILPTRTKAFLGAFAGSLPLHVAELALRAAIGAALVAHAPRMLFSTGALWFGWLLLGTTAVLALVPWRIHRRFAEWSVPRALRFLPAIAVGSLAGGILLLVALFAHPTAR